MVSISAQGAEMFTVKGSDDSIAVATDIEKQADLLGILGDELASSPFDKYGAFRVVRDRGFACGCTMPSKLALDTEGHHV